MTPEDQNLPEREGGDLLAAEYVLGVLDRDERAAASQRIESEPAFARAVDGWESHLSPLSAGFAPVEPPAHIKPAIDRRLFTGTAAATAKPSLWASLSFWRGLTLASVAAFALAVAVPLFNPPAAPGGKYMARLVADSSDVTYAAAYDANMGMIALAHMSGAKETGRDFELWMIEGKAAPVSMGVIPEGDMITIQLTPDVKAKLAAGAVLAISLEPAGGSPTGQPTGPVVAAGDLRSL
jgi:anti-sigma-K factor RskA